MTPCRPKSGCRASSLNLWAPLSLALIRNFKLLWPNFTWRTLLGEKPSVYSLKYHVKTLTFLCLILSKLPFSTNCNFCPVTGKQLPKFFWGLMLRWSYFGESKVGLRIVRLVRVPYLSFFQVKKNMSFFANAILPISHVIDGDSYGSVGRAVVQKRYREMYFCRRTRKLASPWSLEAQAG